MALLIKISICRRDGSWPPWESELSQESGKTKNSFFTVSVLPSLIVRGHEEFVTGGDLVLLNTQCLGT